MKYSSILSALVLAIAPILDPYIIAEIGSSITIRVNDVLLIFIVIEVSLYRLRINKRNGILIPLCIFMGIMSLLSIISSPSVNLLNQMKIISIWTVYAILLMFIWSDDCSKYFFSFVEIVGLLAIIILLFQFISGNIGIPFWNGRIPFLSLSKYDGWAGYIDRNTGDIRPNSFFQEPSYVGIYIGPLYAYSLTHGKTKKAIIYAFGLFLTTSLVAVFITCIITVYYLMFSNSSKGEKSNKNKIILFIFLFLLLFSSFCFFSPYANKLFNYILRRVSNIGKDLSSERMGSTKIRLLGNIFLFYRYNFIQKLIGIGTMRYGDVYQVINYSNNFVNFILYYGLIGLLGFFMWLAYLKKKLINKKNKIFFVIMILVFAADQQWFSWYFFYLLTFCIMSREIE